MKTGWWKVHFDVTLDGVGIDFNELPASEKRRIQKMLALGAVAGEVAVPTKNEDEPWIGDTVRLNFGGQTGEIVDAMCGPDGRAMYEISGSNGYRDWYHREQFSKVI